MPHIHHTNALSLLRRQSFTPEEQNAIEAAAEMLPWEQLAPMVKDLQQPATAEAAKNAAYEMIAEQEEATRGIAGMCVLAAAMFESTERFLSLGISQQVLDDTFAALHRFCCEYRQMFGVFGFDRGFWAWRQVCGAIFRLGTLEYEYLRLTERTAGLTGLPADTPVLSIHIPSGADMSREALDDSYAQARAFYREHPEVCPKNGMPPEQLLCSTWLLSPTLRPLLKETSGIRRFAEDFELYASESESTGCWYFLFMAKSDTPAADLPEKTSLQRAVKAHLLAGGGIGTGAGLLKR